MSLSTTSPDGSAILMLAAFMTPRIVGWSIGTRLSVPPIHPVDKLTIWLVGISANLSLFLSDRFNRAEDMSMSDLMDEIEKLRLQLREKHNKELAAIGSLADEQAAQYSEVVRALEHLLTAHDAGCFKIQTLLGSLPSRLGIASRSAPNSFNGMFEGTPIAAQREASKPNYDADLEYALKQPTRYTDPPVRRLS